MTAETPKEKLTMSIDGSRVGIAIGGFVCSSLPHVILGNFWWVFGGLSGHSSEERGSGDSGP